LGPCGRDSQNHGYQVLHIVLSVHESNADSRGAKTKLPYLAFVLVKFVFCSIIPIGFAQIGEFGQVEALGETPPGNTGS
jgi:hypothetical protein